MPEFAGQAAFVTGAGSGIGRGIALALASHGAFVWAADVNETGAADSVSMITGAGGRAEALKLDIGSEAEWEAALARAKAGDEPLTILVNCAGISMVTDTFAMSLDNFKKIMDVNVVGTFLGMKHGIPLVANSGGGSVINISSTLGIKAQTGMSAYCGSKGAIRLMTKSVALECAQLRNRVRVNSVHPGFVDTPALRKLIEGDGLGVQKAGPTTFDPHDIAKTRVPIGEACLPEDVAGMVCYLASNISKHVTGAELVIDGGITAG